MERLPEVHQKKAQTIIRLCFFSLRIPKQIL